MSSGEFIIEVGSNDGYLLQQFAKQGHRVLGIDASPAMARLASERGIQTITGLFTPELAATVKAEHGPASLVVANNVFNHADDVSAFARAAAHLLSKDGYFVYELPYWYIGLKSGKFDQIYHEHVSYFTVRSSLRILDSAGLAATHVQVVDYHGGSLRVFARRASEVRSSGVLDPFLKQEDDLGLFQLETYERFMKCLRERRNTFLEKLYHLKVAGTPIVAVGAAAKGNTFLNYYKLDHCVIDCVTDSSPHKQGKYTPGTRIRICGDEVFREYDQVVALVLAWNLPGSLKESLLQINGKINFLVPD